MTVNAAVTIVVDASETDRLFKAFQESIRPSSLEELLAVGAVPWLQARAEGRFTSEGDAASGSWEPLHSATNLVRLLLGYAPAHPINQRDGALRSFVTSSEGEIKPAVDGAELTWPSPGGANEERFKVAQTGSPRGNNPWFKAASTGPRPVVALDSTDLAGLLMAFNVHLIHYMESAGFTVNAF